MKYAFILGRVYTLSFAELLVVLAKYAPDARIVDVSFEAAIIESENALDVSRLQKELGGIIKILKVIDIVKKNSQDSLSFALQHYFKPGKLKNDFLKNTKGKIQFGVSIYLMHEEVKVFGETKRLGMLIKRAMQDSGASIRLVLPELTSLTLASVVVTKNSLLEKGAEICLLAGVDTVYVSKTLTVQDFEDYGRRDYQRPSRDDKQGMIPPKVAQSMLNLSQTPPGEVLLDPFCGVGTILQEGMLLGLRCLGTDKSKVAIINSEKNLEWFRNRYKIPKGKYHLETSLAEEVSKVVDLLAQTRVFDHISSVVTEGYLGPMFTHFPTPEEMKKSFKEITQLWKNSLTEFNKFLPTGAKLVFCLPAYKKDKFSYILLPEVDFMEKLGYSIKAVLPDSVVKSLPFLKVTNRGSVIYDRKDQIVAREIIIIEKDPEKPVT